MSNRYSYRPRLGYDIRVRPPVTDEPPVWEVGVRRCDAENCDRKATTRAPKSPNSLNEYYWFCTEHARQYNRSWNFFKEMSESEAAAYRENEAYGHRPTWPLGARGANPEAAAQMRGFKGMKDTFGVFTEDGPAPKSPEQQKTRRLTRLQSKALRTLGLDGDAPVEAIKARYKELVKRFHPDARGGDRGAEGNLQDVIKAYQILRRAGVC